MGVLSKHLLWCDPLWKDHWDKAIFNAMWWCHGSWGNMHIKETTKQEKVKRNHDFSKQSEQMWSQNSGSDLITHSHVVLNTFILIWSKLTFPHWALPNCSRSPFGFQHVKASDLGHCDKPLYIKNPRAVPKALKVYAIFCSFTHILSLLL